jgi:hypothetical protein
MTPAGTFMYLVCIYQLIYVHQQVIRGCVGSLWGKRVTKKSTVLFLVFEEPPDWFP